LNFELILKYKGDFSGLPVLAGAPLKGPKQ